MLALQGAGRAHSTATIMFHTAMAAYFGLSATDWKCGDIIAQKGPLTAGQLAELTGLTTGAITGLVDRLEKVGIAIRRPDPNDRRRVFIESAPGGEERVLPLFDSLIESFSEVTARYSDEELALILDFMQRSGTAMEQEAAKMRAKAGGG
ncbi:MAG: MarR family transcriptional regulator [Anaerolineae bacterium]|nr:MarR family transcriptional regulator [Anaerolineae bacterium]